MKARLAGESGSRTPLSYSAPAEDGKVRTTGSGEQADNPYANVGRNAPCPCGSGKKFKMCHGRPAPFSLQPTGLLCKIAEVTLCPLMSRSSHRARERGQPLVAGGIGLAAVIIGREPGQE